MLSELSVRFCSITCRWRISGFVSGNGVGITVSNTEVGNVLLVLGDLLRVFGDLRAGEFVHWSGCTFI